MGRFMPTAPRTERSPARVSYMTPDESGARSLTLAGWHKDSADRIRELIASDDGYTEQDRRPHAAGVSGEGGLMIHSPRRRPTLSSPSPVREGLRCADDFARTLPKRRRSEHERCRRL